MQVSEETGHASMVHYYHKKGLIEYAWEYHGYASKDYVRCVNGKDHTAACRYVNRNNTVTYYKGNWGPDGTEISKNTFTKIIKSYKGNAVLRKVIYYPNTAYNRSKYLK